MAGPPTVIYVSTQRRRRPRRLAFAALGVVLVLGVVVLLAL
jgi:hypothetical protein